MNAGGIGARRRDFLGDKRLWIETREATGIAKNPNGMIGRQDQLACHSAIETVFCFPHSPAICLRIPHGNAIVGANPKAIAGIAHLGPDNIVGKAFAACPRRPSFSTDPTLDTRSAEANPISALAVFGDGKSGVGGHAAALIDDFPLTSNSAVEALHSGNHQVALPIQGRGTIVIGGRKTGEFEDELIGAWI